MSASSVPIWEKIEGVQGSTFQVGGPHGPAWVASGSSALEARDSLGAFATVRGGSPVLPNDLIPLGYSSNLGALRGIADANGHTISSGTVVFSNSNQVSFGLSGSTLTASFNAAAGQFGGIADSITQVTAGTVTFSNSNGVSFGLAGSVMTASASGGEFMGAGTQTGTAATVVFANSNNVTFGMGGQSQITASATYAPVLAFFENLSGPMWMGQTYASMSVVPLAANVFPGLMTCSTFLLGLNGLQSQSTSSGTLVLSLGIYTLTGSTLNLLNSAATSLTWGTASNASTAFWGPRWLSIHQTQWSALPTFSQTNYWLGYLISSSNATQGVSLIGQAYANAQARWGTVGVGAAAPAGSYGWRPMMGAYTATTGALPATMGAGDLNVSFTAVGNFLPHVILNNVMQSF